MAFYIILAGRWLSSESSNLICLCFSACLCFCGTYGVLSCHRSNRAGSTGVLTERASVTCGLTEKAKGPFPHRVDHWIFPRPGPTVPQMKAAGRQGYVQ
ncbi:hypothetical protein BDV24DRAFT_122513 [Aspergillus arachidicola]|uniref:Uncharacterized protein n=1 Tax=Aspergillus arachidicola TaxID=656916 RepID=A0A5N6YN55_9EURO|nr:hypothetical protein BDV24DRAFT_122513 [Aspergillus arachidicola]